MNRITALTTATISLLALTLGAATVFAQAGTGQALEIAPPVISLKADPGQTITTKINLRGVSSETLLVKGQVNDFAAAGEDGTPKLILENSDTKDPYSIIDWVTPLPQITLEPRQIKDMPVTIHVPADAAPGGYYGVVRFTAAPPELEGTGVSLSASLGSLVFIRVSGEAKEQMNVEEFSVASGGNTGSLFEATPLQFIERLKNTGNTHLQPSGQITIKDMFGQKVATINVNLPPGTVLPSSIRKFEQTLDKATIGDAVLFGRYTADLKITYGDSHQELTSSTTFWIIPYKLIGVGLIVIVGGFFLLRFLLRRYNQRVIRKSKGRGLRL